MPETKPDHIPSSDELTRTRTGNFFVRDGVLLPTEDFINNTDGCRTCLKGTYTVQEEVRVIGHGAFRNCTNLQAVLLPEGISAIEPLAFAGCSSLVRLMVATQDSWQPEIVIPYGVENIGYKAFSGCSQVTQVRFESRLAYLAPSTFEGCLRLKKVEGCGSLGAIARAAFRGCDDLQELVGLKSSCMIESYAFAGCSRFEASGNLNMSEVNTSVIEDRPQERTPEICVEEEQEAVPEEDSVELVEEETQTEEEPEDDVFEIASVVSKKSKRMPWQDKAIYGGAANRKMLAEYIGGHLYLHRDRLYFKPHPINIQASEVIIPLDDIDSVAFFSIFGFFPTGLEITLLNGQIERFSVNSRKEWRAQIEQAQED